MKIAAIRIVNKVATIPGIIHKIIPNTIPVIPNVTNLFVRLVSLCNVFSMQVHQLILLYQSKRSIKLINLELK